VFLPWWPVSGDYSGLQAQCQWGLRDFFGFQALGLGARIGKHQHQDQTPIRPRDCPDSLPIIQSGRMQQTTTKIPTADVDRLNLLEQVLLLVPIRR
jgi:hypothetical protein